MTREIPLGNDRFAIVDDADYEQISRYSWRYVRIHTSEYAVIKGRRDLFFMHRLLINPPSGHEVDHQDGNGLNNTRHNLRVVSHAQNISKHKGVVWHKPSSKWRARITVAGLRISLGLFPTELDAARAYNEAALKYHGEFARLNDIDAA